AERQTSHHGQRDSVAGRAEGQPTAAAIAPRGRYGSLLSWVRGAVAVYKVSRGNVKRRTIIVAILALLAAPALADTPPDTVFLEELTWPELRALVQAGKTTIILPIGGTEQSGPHLALGKHNGRVRAPGERRAAALGNAVVGRVIAYVPEGSLSPTTGHMRFPGTITVPDEVFRRGLESAARSARVQRFRDRV